MPGIDWCLELLAIDFDPRVDSDPWLGASQPANVGIMKQDTANSRPVIESTISRWYRKKSWTIFIWSFSIIWTCLPSGLYYSQFQTRGYNPLFHCQSTITFQYCSVISSYISSFDGEHPYESLPHNQSDTMVFLLAQVVADATDFKLPPAKMWFFLLGTFFWSRIWILVDGIPTPLKHMSSSVGIILPDMLG